MFYRLDALIVAQPMVSKHWRWEIITLHGLAHPELSVVGLTNWPVCEWLIFHLHLLFQQTDAADRASEREQQVCKRPTPTIHKGFPGEQNGDLSGSNRKTCRLNKILVTATGLFHISKYSPDSRNIILSIFQSCRKNFSKTIHRFILRRCHLEDAIAWWTSSTNHCLLSIFCCNVYLQFLCKIPILW